MRRGLLVVYTGEGRGKTTAVLGQVFRALGRGLRSCIIQFTDGSLQPGKLPEASRFGDLLDIYLLGSGFTWESEDREKEMLAARDAWKFAKATINSGKYAIVVLAEITSLMKHHMVEEDEIVEFLKAKPQNVHLIATGQRFSQSLMEAADLVTEVSEVEHLSPSDMKGGNGMEL